MKRLADKSLSNMGPIPTTRSLALCLEEEIRLGNSFVHCIDGDISVFLLNQPFHRFALNELVINNQDELSPWCITDALLDSEVRRILDNNLPFPDRSGRWKEDVRQCHLELGNLNPYGKGVDERVWSPVPDCYRSVEGLSGLLPTCVGDALGFLLREGNEIELVDDWSPDFFKIVLRHPFELNSVSAFFEHQPAETFSVDDPHYELLTGWSLENEDGSLVVSSGMMPLARRVLLGHLHD
jgi:hypothetical protein